MMRERQDFLSEKKKEGSEENIKKNPHSLIVQREDRGKIDNKYERPRSLHSREKSRSAAGSIQSK